MNKFLEKLALGILYFVFVLSIIISIFGLSPFAPLVIKLFLILWLASGWAIYYLNHRINHED